MQRKLIWLVEWLQSNEKKTRKTIKQSPGWIRLYGTRQPYNDDDRLHKQHKYKIFSLRSFFVLNVLLNTYTYTHFLFCSLLLRVVVVYIVIYIFSTDHTHTIPKEKPHDTLHHDIDRKSDWSFIHNSFCMYRLCWTQRNTL